MSKIAWILSVYVTVIIASEAENEGNKTICTYNTTITVDKHVMVTKAISTEQKTCKKWDWFKLFCKTKTIYRAITANETLRVPEQQTVLGCCKGYVNETGVCRKAPCPFGLYGTNCTENCTRKENQYKECTMTGQCICKDGWIGENCSQACNDSKYGRNCQWDCSCTNNAKCDHIKGSCNCSTIRGWTGDRCEKKCLPTFYGPDCSLPCNCLNDRVCDHQTGNCSCKAGKTGDNCSQDCSRMKFGINCIQSCLCNDEGTASCDNVNGSCVCRHGWMGSTCAEECSYGKFGKDCNQNCTCNDKELCNTEDGSCLLADVCVSDYTKNCIANVSFVKCDSLKNICNDTEQRKTKKGLEKSAADLCCRDINQDYSLCLSHVNCSCNEVSTGTHCEASQSMNSHQPSAKGLDNGSAVVPATVATTLIIIALAVVIVIVFVIRRQRNKKHRPPVVHNQIYGASELDVVEGVTANNGHVTSADTYDHVNKHNQRTDANKKSNMYSSTTDNRENEYDVSSRATRNTDVNRNSNVYSSTADTNDNEYDVSSHVTRNTDVNRNSNVYSSTTESNDNEYDVSCHIRRNIDGVRNSNIYSATTNTHESEYDVSSHLVEQSSLMNGDDAKSCDHLVRGDNVGDGDTDDMYDHMTGNVDEENYNTLENHI